MLGLVNALDVRPCWDEPPQDRLQMQLAILFLSVCLNSEALSQYLNIWNSVRFCNFHLFHPKAIVSYKDNRLPSYQRVDINSITN